MIYTAVRADHYNRLNEQQKRKLFKNEEKANKIHSLMIKKAAAWGPDEVLANPAKFRKSVLGDLGTGALSSVLGFLIPLIGPLLVQMLMPILIEWLTETFIKNRTTNGQAILADLARQA